MSDRVTGTTHQWTFEGGPTAGKTYEHVFGTDGTVAYREVTGESAPAGAGEKHPRYAAFDVTPDVTTVSYLSENGFTLTVVLSYRDRSLVGFASNEKQWFPLRGRFEERR